MKRIPSRELLDDDAGTPAEVAASLEDIRFLNRYFGGIATTRRLLERVAKKHNRKELSLLEVAAGTGYVPVTVRSRLQQKGMHLDLTLLDQQASHMKSAAGERTVVGDALALPFQNNSFDIVSCNLFLHHLAPEQVTLCVEEALRCARLAVVINDLIRDPVHWAVAHAGRVIYRSRLTRSDAPASVRQAYTLAEMRALLPGAEVDLTRHYFYRMGAIVWKPSGL